MTIKLVPPPDHGEGLLLLANRLLIVVDVLRDRHPALVPIVQDASTALRRCAAVTQQERRQP